MTRRGTEGLGESSHVAARIHRLRGEGELEALARGAFVSEAQAVNLRVEIGGVRPRFGRGRAAELELQRAADGLPVTGGRCEPPQLSAGEGTASGTVRVLGGAAGAFEVTGERPREMMSGAGHDGQALVKLTDIGMIFVRCRGGISHNPLEFVSVEDLGLAVEALIQTILEIAREKAE